MSDWPTVTLDALAATAPNSFVDGPFGSSLKAEEYTSEGVPIIRLQNIRPNKFIAKQIRFISEEKARQLSRHSYRPGDLVIAKLGDPCGMACVLPSEAGEGRIVADVVRFRGQTDKIDHHFLSYFINSPMGRFAIDRDAKGATRQRVNLSNFKALKIPLPSLPEQRRIAAILDQADALRAKRREALAELDKLTQSIFIEMFGDPISNPRGWTKLPLESVTSKVTDGEHLNPELSESGMPIVMAGNVLENSIDMVGAKKVSEELGDRFRRKCKPELGDLLVVSRGATIGRMCAVNTNESFCLMGSVILLKLKKDRVNTDFMSALLKQPVMRSALYKTSGSSAQQAIYLKDLKNLSLICPPLELQQKFSSKVTKIVELKTRHSDSLDAINSLFSSLQHRAFRGEL